MAGLYANRTQNRKARPCSAQPVRDEITHICERHLQGGPTGAERVKGACCARGKRFAAPAGRLANLHAGKRSLPLTAASAGQ